MSHENTVDSSCNMCMTEGTKVPQLVGEFCNVHLASFSVVVIVFFGFIYSKEHYLRCLSVYV